MAKKLIIRDGTKILGTLSSGLGDNVLTIDAASREVGSIPPIDVTGFIPTALTDSYIIVGSSSNIATPRLMTGQVTINNLGVSSISPDTITNTHVNSAAGIVYSKLNLTGGIINTDISVAANITRTKIANGTAY